ncbi:MAG: peptide deformylase [Candidatus Dormibacteria bacterium]
MKPAPPLELVTDPATVLHQRARPVRSFDQSLRRLVDEMYIRCEEWNGVGLAGPQVGLNLQLAVIVYEDRKFVICNPERLSSSGEVDSIEGCLSLPGRAGKIRRFERVTVRYRNVHGRGVVRSFEGWLARIVQHESDHLQGMLCPERLAPGAVFQEVMDDEDEAGAR